MRINPRPHERSNGLGTAAFLALYDSHAEPLLRYFARRTLDPEAAFDLTAETFAEAFASRAGSKDDYERIEAMIDFAAVGRQVRSALHTLPSDQREAVVYRVIDELSYEQIADRIGCSQDAARARVSRGLRLLARTLAPPDDDIRGRGAER